MRNDSQDHTLISIKEAAERGYGSASTLGRRIRSGALPATRVRGCWLRVRVSDLEALGGGHDVPRQSGDGHE